jgi:hypothetical protein
MKTKLYYLHNRLKMSTIWLLQRALFKEFQSFSLRHGRDKSAVTILPFSAGMTKLPLCYQQGAHEANSGNLLSPIYSTAAKMPCNALIDWYSVTTGQSKNLYKTSNECNCCILAIDFLP